MAELFNTGVDAEFVTLLLVIISLIIVPIVYHLQKSRPKMKIKQYSSTDRQESQVRINVNVQNIGDKVAEEVKYEMTSMTKEVTIIVDDASSRARDVHPTAGFVTEATVNFKIGQKCKIKLKVSWDNLTNKLKKRNSLTHEFTCTRLDNGKVDFKEIEK